MHKYRINLRFFFCFRPVMAKKTSNLKSFWFPGITYVKRFRRKKEIILIIGLPQNILKYSLHITDLAGRNSPPIHLFFEHFDSSKTKIYEIYNLNYMLSHVYRRKL